MKKKETKESNDESTLLNEIFCFICLCALSLVSRLYRVEIPRHICWDETHFGKMGSWYINRTFFFDVHPPLGKMLIALFGYITGYDGSFPFDKPGDVYDKDEQYLGMRYCCALLGAGLIPLSYLIVRELGQSVMAATIASTLILLDVGTATLTRYILLDPILLFFIMAANFCLLKFLNAKDRPFTLIWWTWMSLTGFFLACSLGVKFVGLFVIILAGLSTAWDLWCLLGDCSNSMYKMIQHLTARVLCLIILPAVVYSAFFAIHFQILNMTGNGDGFFSSAFQSQLIGNKLYNITMPQNIAYGSVVTVKQSRTAGGYLHSHHHLYPLEDAPKQQQVTTYSHKDSNNYWKVNPPSEGRLKTDQILYLKNGDLLRLEHIETHRNLHSHQEVAPISKRHFQVSGYGQNGVGDENDIWVIMCPGYETGEPIRTVNMRFHLIHYNVKCHLQSHEKKLPKWGWEQLEVTCNPVRDPKTLWNIEEVVDDRLPNVSFDIYSPSFIDKLIESHAVMTQGNSGLKPKEGEAVSRPWQWPINFKGQPFSGLNHRVYLLGNPIIFWLNIVVIVVFLLIFSIIAVRRQRKVKTDVAVAEYTERVFAASWWLIGAWLIHYLPFWAMTRVLYFHHYFPAFLYSCMLSGVVLDYVIIRISWIVPSRFSNITFHLFMGLLFSTLSYSFYLFYPLTYGMDGPDANNRSSTMYGLKWMPSWDF